MYTRDEAKLRATKLRAILKDQGTDITHGNALEVIAKQYNYKDWNTCAAAMDMRGKLLPLPEGWSAHEAHRQFYEYGTDPSIIRNGSNPIAIRFKDNAPIKDFCTTTLMNQFKAAKYSGKRVQMTVEMKIEDGVCHSTMWLSAFEKTANIDDNKRRAHEKSTHKWVEEQSIVTAEAGDWALHTIVLDIPQATDYLLLGLGINGRGSVLFSGFTFTTVSEATPLTATLKGFSQGPGNWVSPN